MRGDKLRQHILFTAKDVFLEMGFERATMEAVAARADTSKRTVYAHFENKETLYLGVIDLVRDLFLSRLQTLGDYPGEPAEALTQFCGQFLESLLYQPAIRMCRLCMAEAERFPEAAARHFGVLFSAPHERLSAYFTTTFGLSADAGADAAQALLGRVIFPRFLRALFGMDAPLAQLGEEGVSAEFDLAPVRAAVAELMEALTAQPGEPRPGEPRPSPLLSEGEGSEPKRAG